MGRGWGREFVRRINCIICHFYSKMSSIKCRETFKSFWICFFQGTSEDSVLTVGFPFPKAFQGEPIYRRLGKVLSIVSSVAISVPFTDAGSYICSIREQRYALYIFYTCIDYMHRFHFQKRTAGWSPFSYSWKTSSCNLCTVTITTLLPVLVYFI